MRHPFLSIPSQPVHVLGCMTSLVSAVYLLGTSVASAQQTDTSVAQPSAGAVPGGSSGAVIVAPQGTAPQTPSTVTPPQLKRFVPAQYPPQAEREGREGSVVLQLDIGADGKVGSVAVVNPAGHGFDDNAVEAAKQFEFSPATRGTTPIPSRILYRYSFTLQAKEPSADSATGQAAPVEKVKSLSGVVRSSAGDVPLPGVTVVVAGANGKSYEAVTDESGAWALLDLAPGPYSVKVRSAGFQPLEVTEQVTEGQATEVIYRLSAEGMLEVVIRGKRPPREVTKRTLERREIERIPGTNGDALRSIQNLPGVARPPAFAGLLVVRGSAPNDTNVFIDGALVPLVYHFGGLSSVVPTELLEKIDFYPGNFSAQFGRVTGGIVDVGLRSPKGDGKYHGLGQFDLIDGRAMLEGPIPGLKNWNFIASFRRSWFDVWLKPVLNAAGAAVTAAPVYHDFQVMAETRPNARSRFRLLLLGSDDRFEVLSKETAEADPILGGNLRLHTGFWRLMAEYQNDLTDRLSFRSVLAYGQNILDFGVGSLFFNLKTNPLINRTELSYRVAPGVTFHTGIDMWWADSDINVRAPMPPRAGEPNPGPFASRPPMQVRMQTAVYRPAAYGEVELTPHPRVKIVPGVRVDYARDIKRWDVSPRVNARYVLHEGFPKTTLKGGYGIFSSPPQFQETAPPFGTPGLRFERAVHYSLGFEQEITNRIDLSVEGFYKDLDRLVSRAPDEFGQYTYNNLGRGAVVGSEFLLKYRPDSHFFGWIAYTLSRATRKSGPDLPEYLFQYDQTHILTALGSYRLGRGWEFGARFRYVTGNLYTPILGSLYDASAGAYAAVQSPIQNSTRLPAFQQLDLRVDKRWNFGVWRLSTYLDVQNVYYSQNVEGYNYNYNYTKKTPVTGLPIIPSIGIRGEF